MAALQAAARYFRVARNFPKAYDVRPGIPRLKPALDVVDGIDIAALDETNMVSAIMKLRQELARPYGKRDLLSAATKFLWLRRTEVVVSFDGQARHGLAAPPADYSIHYDLWFEHYERNRPAIANACSRLFQEIPEKSRRSVGLGNDIPEWFRRCIHDIHLWRTGNGASE